MQIRGRRITIAGSASTNAEAALLEYTHKIVEQLVAALFAEGALFGVGIGKEPRRMDDDSQASIIFDWTVLEVVGANLKADVSKASTPQGPIVASVTTSKTAIQVPETRKQLWADLLGSNAVLIKSVEPGWTSGAVRRQIQSELGDVLIAISGGEGVEHLAKEFALQGKPVIPLDLQLGSSSNDGVGGAGKLFDQMQSHPERFLSLSDPNLAGALIAQCDSMQGSVSATKVVDGIIRLIRALKPPKAFYVRLLNQKEPDFSDVEQYFRRIVDTVVNDFGYESVEMGKTDTTSPYMEKQIFESIHNAGVVVVDLTGVRPNCFTEMGYAFGRGRKVIVTAREGTAIPFDTSTVEANMWTMAKGVPDSISQLKQYWQRNINRPPLVIPRSIL